MVTFAERMANARRKLAEGSYQQLGSGAYRKDVGDVTVLPGGAVVVKKDSSTTVYSAPQAGVSVNEAAASRVTESAAYRQQAVTAAQRSASLQRIYDTATKDLPTRRNLGTLAGVQVEQLPQRGRTTSGAEAPARRYSLFESARTEASGYVEKLKKLLKKDEKQTYTSGLKPRYVDVPDFVKAGGSIRYKDVEVDGITVRVPERVTVPHGWSAREVYYEGPNGLEPQLIIEPPPKKEEREYLRASGAEKPKVTGYTSGREARLAQTRAGETLLTQAARERMNKRYFPALYKEAAGQALVFFGEAQRQFETPSVVSLAKEKPLETTFILGAALASTGKSKYVSAVAKTFLYGYGGYVGGKYAYELPERVSKEQYKGAFLAGQAVDVGITVGAFETASKGLSLSREFLQKAATERTIRSITGKALVGPEMKAQVRSLATISREVSLEVRPIEKFIGTREAVTSRGIVGRDIMGERIIYSGEYLLGKPKRLPPSSDLVSDFVVRDLTVDSTVRVRSARGDFTISSAYKDIHLFSPEQFGRELSGGFSYKTYREMARSSLYEFTSEFAVGKGPVYGIQGKSGVPEYFGAKAAGKRTPRAYIEDMRRWLGGKQRTALPREAVEKFTLEGGTKVTRVVSFGEEFGFGGPRTVLEVTKAGYKKLPSFKEEFGVSAPKAPRGDVSVGAGRQKLSLKMEQPKLKKQELLVVQKVKVGEQKGAFKQAEARSRLAEGIIAGPRASEMFRGPRSRVAERIAVMQGRRSILSTFTGTKPAYRTESREKAAVKPVVVTTLTPLVRTMQGSRSGQFTASIVTTTPSTISSPFISPPPTPSVFRTPKPRPPVIVPPFELKKRPAPKSSFSKGFSVKARQPVRYTPTAHAAGFGITGPKKRRKMFTGLEERPLRYTAEMIYGSKIKGNLGLLPRLTPSEKKIRISPRAFRF